ncbi:MAG TPA: EamA family transporter [Candidatus Angelobacter sp.]
MSTPSSANVVPPSAEAPAAARHPWRGYFLIAAATLCWAAAATAGKAVFSGRLFTGHAEISPLILSQTRATVADALLWAFLLLRYGPRFLRISPRDLLLCFLVGTLGLAGSNFFYYVAIQKATVAIAITLQYLAPVWVLLAMVLWGRERATLRRLGAVLLAMAGCALTIGFFQAGQRFSTVGVAAGVMASFSFAFYNIGAQRLVSRHHPFQVMAYTLLGTAILWGVLNPPWRLLAQDYSGGQWAFLFLFACISMLLPYFFYFSGLKYLDPTRAVIASCLEPVFAILFAAMFVHEGLHMWQIVGIIAVLCATVMVQPRAPERPAGMKDRVSW